MERYNVIMLVDKAGRSMLMCKRLRNPYKGLHNFVGGKVEADEDGLHAAYRELREETGISAADVTLHHVVTFCYPEYDEDNPAYELMSYVGRLRRQVHVSGDENPLEWVSLDQQFFDMNRFAGEGSVGHIVETVRMYRPAWLDAQEQQITLEPLAERHLPILAYYQGCTVEDLQPMLAASRARCHEGRYYEQFAVCVDGCMVGAVSLFAHEDGTVCDGVDIFPVFRRCGFAAQGLTLLSDIARFRGYQVQTAQVRTDNAASIALHGKLGFIPGEPWINSKGSEVRTWRKEL